MRWVKYKVFPIVLVLMVAGGYYLTTSHLLETGDDTRLNQKYDMSAEVSMDQLMTGIEDLPSGNASAAKGIQATAESELALLRKELLEMRNQQASIQQALDSLMSADNFDDENDSEYLEIENPGVAMEETAKLDNDFESETIDPEWGGSAELEIQSALEQGALKGVSVSSAECRSTACRIEVKFDDSRSEMEGNSSLPMLMPWIGESYISKQSTDDGRSSVLYVAREGYSLSGEMTEAQEQ